MKKEAIDARKDKIVTSNRKAEHLYFVLERYEAGIELKGTEVKSLRRGRASLTDSYALIKDGEVIMLNSHINEYEEGNRFNHDPRRPRKLLMHKTEIRRLFGKIKERGYTLVPLCIYFHDNVAKVEIALVKGKKTFDRQQTIEDRDANRDMERSLKEHYRQKPGNSD